MAQYTYDTFADLNAAGELTLHRETYYYRGARLKRRDVSGPKQFGYKYALCGDLRPKMAADSSEDVEFGQFAESVDVILHKERNQIGGLGCISTRHFRVADVEAARAAFRRVVDMYYDANPLEACAQAAQEALDKTRLYRRALKLAKKYGADQLDEMWQEIIREAKRAGR